jgi:hypothetical protein
MLAQRAGVRIRSQIILSFNRSYRQAVYSLALLSLAVLLFLVFLLERKNLMKVDLPQQSAPLWPVLEVLMVRRNWQKEFSVKWPIRPASLV